MVEDSKTLSERIKKERKKLGLSQQELAEKSGIAYNSYQAWEIGRRFPNESSLEILAKFFNVSPLYLTGETAFRNTWEEYDSLHKEDLKRIRTELQFTESAEKLGFLDQSADDPEGDYERYIAYNRMYQERKDAMKTRKDIKVIIGSDENRIIDNFETGEITIEAITEDDIEKGFQQLISRGIIAD